MGFYGPAAQGLMTHRVSAVRAGTAPGREQQRAGHRRSRGPGPVHVDVRAVHPPRQRLAVAGRAVPAWLPAPRHRVVARRSRHARAMNLRLACAALIAACPALAQSPIDREVTGRAVRVTAPPVIDGRDDDAAWKLAPPITGFRQFDPGEDLDPAFRTEARAVYDDRYLYVVVRAYDPHPDSIVSLLSRRDVKTASDQLKLIIDAFHDQRTAVEFAINPAGVKRDYAIYSDITEDVTWDGVWDAAAHVDSKGWVAEFRIPFSQLRFNADTTNDFGFGVWRDIARLQRARRVARVPPLGEHARFAARHADRVPRPRAGPPARAAAVRRREECERTDGHRIPEREQGFSGPRPEGRPHAVSAARRDAESGLRPGGGRSGRAQPVGLRDPVSRTAPVLPGRCGSLHLRRSLRGALLHAPHRTFAGAPDARVRSGLHDHHRRRQAHGTVRQRCAVRRRRRGDAAHAGRPRHHDRAADELLRRSRPARTRRGARAIRPHAHGRAARSRLRERAIAAQLGHLGARAGLCAILARCVEALGIRRSRRTSREARTRSR